MKSDRLSDSNAQATALDGTASDSPAPNSTASDSTAPTSNGPPINRPMAFAVVSLAILMTTIDATIVATALEALQEGLDTTLNWAAWTMTAYMFGFVLMLPIAGELSQRYGRRRIFIWSTVIFTAASIACGFSNNIYVLIAMRVLQAVGGAGFTPSATGIIVDYFGSARDRATSLFGSMFPIGEMIGPAFGGVIVTYFTWRDIFFMNVPIGLVVLIGAYRYIPEDPPIARDTIEPMDWRGMVYLSVSLLAGMYATTALGDAEVRVASSTFILPVVLSVAMFSVFIRHIRRERVPFVAPRMLYGQHFGVVNLFNAMYAGVAIGMMALVPLYASHRYGLSPMAAGLLLTAQGFTSVTCTLLVTFAMRRTGHRRPLFVGALLIVAGLLLVAWGPQWDLSPQVWLLAATGVVGMGVGTVNPPSRNAGLQLEPESSSALAALRTMSINLGAMVSVAIATAVIAGAAHSDVMHARFYAAVALLMFLGMPMIRKVPEHHGAW